MKTLKTTKQNLTKLISISLMCGLLSPFGGDGGGLYAQAPNLPGAGNCLNFDGVDDYVVVLDNPVIESLNNGTVSFWFNSSYTGTPANVNGFFSKEMGSTPRALYGAYHFTDGNLYLHLNNSPAIFMGPFVPTKGRWYHITFTWDGTNAKSYINGILNQVTPTTLGSGANSLNFYIGSYVWNDVTVSQFATGQIDEFRIWNVARTQAEIRQNMCQKLTGNEPGLVGYWRFDEGTGNTAFDSSPNGNNGTLF